ncbi:hypothetical protein VPARA_62610 [Variovorax paradoxus]|uniref:Uncharacterized protein n=1 Tax=Variovorax paradoxus TaxID=34073 RepID=A0A0H2LVV1_VARPD|nr:hypothetical protein VPARA_62610 [Variovorax paradoxus]
MPSVLIRLDARLLVNPDTDLRYVIPDRLADISEGVLSNDAFDYEEGTDAMLIYLSTHNVDAALPFVINVLENEAIYDNRLADSAKVGISLLDETERPADFVVVYPSAEAGARMG